jgi:hypothetical protein
MALITLASATVLPCNKNKFFVLDLRRKRSGNHPKQKRKGPKAADKTVSHVNSSSRKAITST